LVKINHYIIAPSPWRDDGLKFRRHRIAEYLLKHPDTKSIIWLYPISVHSLKNGKKYILNKYKLDIHTSSSEIQEIGLLDLKGFLKHSKKGLIFEKRMMQKIQEPKNDEGSILNYLWFTHPAFSWLATDQLFNWDKVIYDCSDLWTSSFVKRNGILNKFETIRTQRIVSAEIDIINRADKITATSDYLSNKINKSKNKEILVIENGVEYELFTKKDIEDNVLKEFEDIPKPRLGFIGGLKHKIDFELLYKIAKKEPNFSIVLAGPVTENKPDGLKELLALANVFYLGTIDPVKVPQFMRCLDIGLLPYKEIEYNKAISPLKLFEYIASGLPAVGCGLPMTLKYEKSGIYTHCIGNEELIINECKKMLIKDSDQMKKLRELEAKNHSWEQKLEFILKYVQS